ncbi:unnamed protein product, partial [Closterium sp. NIES-54]
MRDRDLSGWSLVSPVSLASGSRFARAADATLIRAASGSSEPSSAGNPLRCGDSLGCGLAMLRSGAAQDDAPVVVIPFDVLVS